MLREDTRQCPDDGAAPVQVETLPAGTRLGAYRIDRVLGEGGMGFVYEATHETLNRRSAIKMLRPELAKLEQIVTRFLNEAKAVNVIDHQHIVNVYDYGDGADGSVYFVMEFLEGETLDDLMYKKRPMSMPLLLHVFGQVARALAAAHAKRIVHRDLKPANVFVTAREDNPYFVKLLDFGIAQLRGEGAVQGLTVAGMVMGTPQYMSPEQVSGGTVDARTDVWALGVMMYRAATGQAPFPGEEFVELADAILHRPPPPAGALVPLPASLSALIASCLERNLEARCPSVDALLAGLERVKLELGLDGDAILEAVRAEAGMAAVGLPAPRDRTRGSRAGSVPRFPGAGVVPAPHAAPAGAGRRTSRRGRYVTVGAIAGGLASAGFVLFGGGDEARPVAADTGSGSGSAPPAPPTPPTPAPPGPSPSARCDPAIEAAFEAGKLPEVRRLAEAHLRTAIESGTAQQRGAAVEALALARVPAGAPLLYPALKSPDVSVKAARALGELALPSSAPKVREALAEAGGKLKVVLAAALDRLGDRSGRSILKRALQEPGMRLDAALALAEAGEKASLPVLAEILADTPEGRDNWRSAAGGLMKAGDPGARKLLEGELAQPDAARSVGAAYLLARAGDARARDQLALHMKDPEFARPGDAALALARLGDKRALDWVGGGLESPDSEERKLALGIAGALAADAATHAGAIAKLAGTEPNLGVCMTAEAVLLGL
ncbi:MAG TPA: protein kinase [Kofleriaceae bacterium]|nr:protein kinase [Kofleriaceae bacterium]